MNIEPTSRPRPVTQVEHVRGTQSLVQIQAQCWRRPGLIARELAWRWLFGVPALLLLFVCGWRLLAILFAAHTGLENFSLQQPVMAAQIVRASNDAILPAARELARWVAPLLMIGWAVASGAGRAFVLRALTPGSRLRPVPLALLQLLRIVALVLTVLVWFAMVRWAAQRDITHVAPGTEPSMVAFAAWLICLSIGSFIVWALWSWVLSIASVLIVVDGRTLPAALAGSVRLGPLTMKLVEINLVLGIVKLAIIVLAMVFSAIPLPFETQMTGNALHLWWAAVGVWYLAASDFFQVARLAAFVEFWQSSGGLQNNSE
ncbi:MAG TPA: hypothetical protein VGM02_13515 [Acidobacteriaceae bacterium]